MASPGQRDPASDPDEKVAKDVLEAFNAEGVIDNPGRPEAEAGNPADPTDDASDAEAPAP